MSRKFFLFGIVFVSLVTFAFFVEKERRENAIFSIPILTYHAVFSQKKYIWDDVQVTTEQFENHLNYLQNQGYSAVTFEDVRKYQKFFGTLPDKPIILTFDDSHRTLYTNVFPLLQEYNMKGVFFVNSNWVDTEVRLTWKQIREMHSTGMEIGSHSANHTELIEGIGPGILRAEVADDKKKIELELGEKIYAFSYPANTVAKETISLLKAIGYITARTGEQRSNLDLTLLNLKSFIIETNISLKTFGI